MIFITKIKPGCAWIPEIQTFSSRTFGNFLCTGTLKVLRSLSLHSEDTFRAVSIRTRWKNNHLEDLSGLEKHLYYAYSHRKYTSVGKLPYRLHCGCWWSKALLCWVCVAGFRHCFSSVWFLRLTPALSLPVCVPIPIPVPVRVPSSFIFTFCKPASLNPTVFADTKVWFYSKITKEIII